MCGDFNTPKLIEQKISNDTEELSSARNQPAFTDICRTLHSVIAEYAYFNASKAFNDIGHILAHKIGFCKIESN